MKIAFIMLAAGNSRRFGSNKLLYEIDGKPMYQHILEKLMTVANTPESITVVTQYEEIEQKARTLGTKVYINPHPDEGISSSLKIGLKANKDADACLFTVSDQPGLPLQQSTSSLIFLKPLKKESPVSPARESLEIPVFLQRNIMKNYCQLLGIEGESL